MIISVTGEKGKEERRRGRRRRRKRRRRKRKRRRERDYKTRQWDEKGKHYTHAHTHAHLLRAFSILFIFCLNSDISFLSSLVWAALQWRYLNNEKSHKMIEMYHNSSSDHIYLSRCIVLSKASASCIFSACPVSWLYLNLDNSRTSTGGKWLNHVY